MKFISVVSLATLAAGHSFSHLPGCAIECFLDALKQSGWCMPFDLGCICDKFEAIQGAAAGCIVSTCGQDIAMNKVLPAAKNLCHGGGGHHPTHTHTRPGTVSPTVTPTVVPEPPTYG